MPGDQCDLLRDTNNLCLLLEGLECRKLSLITEIEDLCEQCASAPIHSGKPCTIAVTPEEFAMLLSSRHEALARTREDLRDVQRLREVLSSSIKNNQKRESLCLK